MTPAPIRGWCMRCGKRVSGHPSLTGDATLRLVRGHRTPDGRACPSRTAQRHRVAQPKRVVLELTPAQARALNSSAAYGLAGAPEEGGLRNAGAQRDLDGARDALLAAMARARVAT